MYTNIGCIFGIYKTFLYTRGSHCLCGKSICLEFALSEANRQLLYEIANKTHTYSAYARSLYYILEDTLIISKIPEELDSLYKLENRSKQKINAQILIYPNPFNVLLNVQFKDVSKAVVQVHDLFGNLVFNDQSTLESQQIDTSDWNKGIYIVTIMEGDNILHQEKIIMIE